MMLME